MTTLDRLQAKLEREQATAQKKERLRAQRVAEAHQLWWPTVTAIAAGEEVNEREVEAMLDVLDRDVARLRADVDCFLRWRDFEDPRPAAAEALEQARADMEAATARAKALREEADQLEAAAPAPFNEARAAVAAATNARRQHTALREHLMRGGCPADMLDEAQPKWTRPAPARAYLLFADRFDGTRMYRRGEVATLPGDYFGDSIPASVALLTDAEADRYRQLQAEAEAARSNVRRRVLTPSEAVQQVATQPWSPEQLIARVREQLAAEAAEPADDAAAGISEAEAATDTTAPSDAADGRRARPTVTDEPDAAPW